VLLAAVAATALTIAVSPGTGTATRHWTLHCAPTGGTLPHAADACTKLTRLNAPFAPVPKQMMCTAIYGGPQTAHVKGTFEGRKINATFNKRGGCELARWNRLGFLFRYS
jgi:hypothetical protein